jgi:hypothetical protein
MDRHAFYQRMGLLKVVDPTSDHAFAVAEAAIREQHLDRAPHGYEWHTSFHASQFPGDYELACPRKALYRLMNVPSQEPLNRSGRLIMGVGSAIEQLYVDAWRRAGVLYLAGSGDADLDFTVPEVWLTGNPDAIVTPLDWMGEPHVVEVKGKDHDKIMDMRRGVTTEPAPEHARQTYAYIGLGRLKIPYLRSGSVFYASRQRPSITHEFFLEHDERFWSTGIDRLRDWKRMFIEDVLPPRDKLWRWTQGECQWCDFKRVCKEDVRRGVTSLTQSCATAYAKTIVPAYDADLTRTAVFDRWKTTTEEAHSG